MGKTWDPGELWPAWIGNTDLDRQLVFIVIIIGLDPNTHEWISPPVPYLLYFSGSTEGGTYPMNLFCSLFNESNTIKNNIGNKPDICESLLRLPLPLLSPCFPCHSPPFSPTHTLQVRGVAFPEILKPKWEKSIISAPPPHGMMEI